MNSLRFNSFNPTSSQNTDGPQPTVSPQSSPTGETVPPAGSVSTGTSPKPPATSLAFEKKFSHSADNKPPSSKATDTSENANAGWDLGEQEKRLVSKVSRHLRNDLLMKRARTLYNPVGFYVVKEDDKHNKGKPLAYIKYMEGPVEPGNKLIKEMYGHPSLLDEGEAEILGSDKRVTHKDKKKDHRGAFIGFTARYGGFDTFTLSEEARDKIIDLKLSRVVLQREVRPRFYVAKRMEGDLLTQVNEGKPIPFSGFKTLLSDLKTLHENGIVHRDIKMDNLPVLENEAYVTDWETADLVDHIEPKSVIPGVPTYVDEQLSKHLQACQSTPELAQAEQRKYAKVMDDYAMTIVLIQNETRRDLKTLSNCETFSFFDDKAKEAITDWTSRHAKPEHVQNLKLLLEDPMSYLSNHQGQPPHLYDMLKFN